MKPARLLVAAALAAVLFAPLAAQESQDAEKRIRDRVGRLLDGELGRMRKGILDDVRGALGGGTAPAVAPKTDGLDAALALVTEDLLKGHASFLASDDLEGRNAGFPGNDKATEYIADVMKKAGLTPIGDEDKDGRKTFFQHFKVSGRTTRNCVGVIEGTDPDLKHEIVVLGAHHDHVGTAEQGHWGRLGRATADDKIWNGADDNGSGTTTVLGLIKAFGEGGIRAKRTILFMTFSGEEAGLLGSAYYTKHPIYPIKQHVFMLNLDMVGRNPEKPVEIHGVGSAEGGVLRKVVESAVEKAGLEAKINDQVKLMGGDSDHTSFKNAGIPFTFFFTGFHADYHRVSDTPEKLAYGNMVKIAKTSAHILVSIADATERPAFSAKGAGGGFNFDDLPGVSPRRRTIGVTRADFDEADMDDAGLGQGEGGVKVESVTPGSVADKAGVKEGDVLLSVGGTGFGRKDPLGDLRKALETVKAGAATDIVVLRDGQRVTLKGTWDR